MSPASGRQPAVDLIEPVEAPERFTIDDDEWGAKDASCNALLVLALQRSFDCRIVDRRARCRVPIEGTAVLRRQPFDLLQSEKTIRRGKVKIEIDRCRHSWCSVTRKAAQSCHVCDAIVDHLRRRAGSALQHRSDPPASSEGASDDESLN